MSKIQYKIGTRPEIQQIIAVYDASGIIRPTDDYARIEKMYANSNLIISAWDGEELIGIARSLTDFCFAYYLSDLAVRQAYQKEGVGRSLIELTQKEIGEQTALILLSAPAAMGYYPKVGFEPIENGFIIKRKK